MNAEMKKAEKSPNLAQNPFIRKIAVYSAVLLIVFLLGFVPMWLTARERAYNLAQAQSQLKVAQMQNMLASAIVDARSGEYESALQSASDFFTHLRAETDQQNNLALTQMQRENIRPLLLQRDEIITLLSRSDSASADRLSSFYVSYCKATGGS